MAQKRTRGGRTRWVGRYRDPSGRERSRTFDTRRDAVAWETEQARAMRRGEWIDPDAGALTLGELTDAWIARSDVPNTIASRRTFRNNLGDLATTPIAKLRPTQLQQWERHLRTGRPWRDGKALAPSSVAGYVREMKSMLNAAVADELLLKNPARNLKAAKGTQRLSPDDVLDVADVTALIAIFEKGQRQMTNAERAKARRGEIEPWRGMQAVPEMAGLVRAAVAMGPRPSELLGIGLRDIDVTRGTVHLRGTKTEAAERTIGVPADVIREMRKRAAEHPSPEGWVMMRGDGTRITLQWAEQRMRAARECLRLGAGATLHGLRHFHATALIAAGVDVKAVQHRLGHRSAAVTLDVYAHWWPAREAHVVEAAARILAGPVRDQGTPRAVN